MKENAYKTREVGCWLSQRDMVEVGSVIDSTRTNGLGDGFVVTGFRSQNIYLEFTTIT